MLMLSRVEGMSADALAAGVDFAGGSLGDFLAGLEGRVGVNVGANVGHCAVRRMVMGDDASERAATDDEIAQMLALTDAALGEGAYGFTSSQLELHVAHDGRGVPSNHAAPDELVALGVGARRVRAGSIEFIPRTFLTGYDDDDRALISIWPHVGGARSTSTRSRQMPARPTAGREASSSRTSSRPTGSRCIRCSRPTGRARTSRSATTFLFDEMPSFRDTLTLPEPERSRSACAIRRCATGCGPRSPTRAAAASCSSGRCCGSKRSRVPSTSSTSTSR